jgi:hypothetical protein
MSYKYVSILKSFEYSKESYQIISDFLLSGNITNPDILLNVTKVSKEFGKIPKNWFTLPTTISFAKALIQIKLENEEKYLFKAFKKFLKNEKIAIGRKSTNGEKHQFIDILSELDYKQLYPKISDNTLYGRVANFINLRVMEQKAKDIRDEKKIKENELTRDYFKELELERIEKVQIFAEMLISQLKIHDFKTLEKMILAYEF